MRALAEGPSWCIDGWMSLSMNQSPSERSPSVSRSDATGARLNIKARRASQERDGRGVEKSAAGRTLSSSLVASVELLTGRSPEITVNKIYCTPLLFIFSSPPQRVMGTSLILLGSTSCAVKTLDPWINSRLGELQWLGLETDVERASGGTSWFTWFFFFVPFVYSARFR